MTTKVMPVSARVPDVVAIDLGDRRYDILIGAGLLGDPASFEPTPL